jgi:hypothetical protein
MFVIIGKKDKTTGVKDDLGAQDDAIPLHHGVQLGLCTQDDMSEFTG